VVALKFELIRPDDLLNLGVTAYNFRIDFSHAKPPFLVQDKAEQPSYLVFHFPPQTTAETAFYEFSPQKPPPGQDNPDAGKTPADTDTKPAPGEVKARIGGPSRLVFRLPGGSTEVKIPLTLEGLLDWSGLELNVTEGADIPPGKYTLPGSTPPPIKQPGPRETAIELPYRLILSPNHEVAWMHARQAVTHQGRTELWHTRLALKKDETLIELSVGQTAPIRAVWSPDYNPLDPPGKTDTDPDLGLTAMSPGDRHQIVILTSAYSGYRRQSHPKWRFIPQPVQAEMLMLTPLGGWLRSRGAWDPPERGQPTVIGGYIPFKETLVDFLKVTEVPELAELELDNLFAGLESGEDLAESKMVDASRLEMLSDISATTGPTEAGELTFTPMANLVLQPLLPVLVYPDEKLDLSEWVHIAAQGRDHYVRIVYEGNLYPFGHRAALIKVTERKFQEKDGSPVAYLVQRMFIVVREPEKDYTQAPLANAGRGMPIEKIRLTTRVTPTIANPYPAPGDPVFPGVEVPGADGSFWVRVAGGPGGIQDFMFHALTQDVAGNWSEFNAAMIFVPLSETQYASVGAAYRADDDRRACQVPGQKVSFAPRDANLKSDNTTLNTERLYFDTDDPALVNTAAYMGFRTKLFKADVHVPAVESLLGTDQPTTIRLFQDYVSQGFANPGGVFAEIVDAAGTTPTTLGVEFSAEKAGGIATPDMGVSSLSRSLGPQAGDVNDAANNDFQPSKFFPPGTALLFGAIDLAGLLLSGSLGDNAPKMEITTEDIPQGKKIITTLTWKPKIKKPPDIGILSFKKDIATQLGNKTELDIKARLEKPVALPGGAPGGVGEGSARIEGELTNFALDFLQVIALQFASFSFKSESGKKTDVNVQLHDSEPVKFQGDLDFVNQLAEIIPPGTFGDGPSLDINLTRIRAGYAITLPPATVGVFALKNLRLAAGLELPFLDGRPMVDFGFASRSDPFLITVSLLGGGGFFFIQLDTKGIKLLELALEFGASADLNLGVASGSVHIMAGIYVAVQEREGVLQAVLSGYLRCGGELSVLGIISVSIEFLLSFTYDSGTEKVSGRATVTVEVEVLFFSASVELTVERSYGAQGGDPTFADLFDVPTVWNEYALAFA